MKAHDKKSNYTGNVLMATNEQILLNEILKQEAEDSTEPLSDGEVFEFYSAIQILKEFDLGHDEVRAGIAGASNDGGADSLYLFVNGDLIKENSNVKEIYKKNPDIEFLLIQSKREKRFGEDVLLKFTRLCSNLLDLNFNREDYVGRYNDNVLSAFNLFRNTYLALVTKTPSLKVSIFYASLGDEIHDNVQNQANDLKKDITTKLPTANVNICFVGAKKLVQLSQKRPNKVHRLAISESPLSTSEKVFIALTNIADYYRFISDDGKLMRHIFESNVRDYQGRTNVNKEIQETLNQGDAEEFWWLNNGVTILGTDATASGGKELIIHNPQIVNGLQTSSEIHRFFSNNLNKLKKEKRSVLVRVIVPDSEKTRDRIIRATNSQTPIPKSSLRATDNIHRNIEEYFKPRSLYYDRRKNFYRNEGRKPKEIISIPFLSQCLMATLLQRPDSARARPSTLLENDESYNKLFNSKNALETYYLLAHWGRNIEINLKDSKKYSTPEISDIKFYALYHSVCIITESLRPSNNKISSLNKEDIDINTILASADICYDLYHELGGTNKIAKGVNLLEKIKDKLKSDNGL